MVLSVCSSPLHEPGANGLEDLDYQSPEDYLKSLQTPNKIKSEMEMEMEMEMEVEIGVGCRDGDGDGQLKDVYVGD